MYVHINFTHRLQDHTINRRWHKAINKACIKVECCMVCFECLHNAFNEWQCKFRCVVALARCVHSKACEQSEFEVHPCLYTPILMLWMLPSPFRDCVQLSTNEKLKQKTQLSSKSYESNWIVCKLFMSIGLKRIQVHLCGFSSSQIWDIAWQDWRTIFGP